MSFSAALVLKKKYFIVKLLKIFSILSNISLLEQQFLLMYHQQRSTLETSQPNYTFPKQISPVTKSSSFYINTNLKYFIKCWYFICIEVIFVFSSIQISYRNASCECNDRYNNSVRYDIKKQAYIWNRWRWESF